MAILSMASSCSNEHAERKVRSEYFARAQKYHDIEQFDEAINIINLIIQSDSCDYEAIYFRARCNFFLANYDKTIKDLFVVADAGYREFDAYYNIGNIYWILAEYSKSVKYFKMAFELDPYNQEVKEIIEVLEEAVEIFENSNNIY